MLESTLGKNEKQASPAKKQWPSEREAWVAHWQSAAKVAELVDQGLKEAKWAIQNTDVPLRIALVAMAKGAGEFLPAIVRGEVVDEGAWECNKAVCRGCPTKVRGRAEGADGESDWCGPPLKKVEGVSCGCLVAIKTLVKGQRCPQGKWDNA